METTTANWYLFLRALRMKAIEKGTTSNLMLTVRMGRVSS